MQIEVKKDVYYDTELPVGEQSETAQSWLREEMLPQLGMSADTALVKPTFDKYQRPHKWQVKGDCYTVNIERIYTSESHSWAMVHDNITLQAQ